MTIKEKCRDAFGGKEYISGYNTKPENGEIKVVFEFKFSDIAERGFKDEIEFASSLGLPKHINGYDVNYKLSGEASFFDGGDYFDPLVGGVEVTHFESDSFGSHGGIVYRGDDMYIISNQHVMAPDNVDPGKGDSILQPSDGSQVGALQEWAFNEDNVDVAIAKVLWDEDDERTIREEEYWDTDKTFSVDNSITKQENLSVGDDVEKIGAITGYTTNGTIESTYMDVNVDDYEFEDCIYIETTDDERFGYHGDSGARVFLSSDDTPIGIIFAGTESGAVYVIPAQRIENVLNVKFEKDSDIDYGVPKTGNIYWGSTVEFEKYEPPYTAIFLQISYDYGKTWHDLINGSPLPKLKVGQDISNLQMEFRIIWEADDQAQDVPKILDPIIYWVEELEGSVYWRGEEGDYFSNNIEEGMSLENLEVDSSKTQNLIIEGTGDMPIKIRTKDFNFGDLSKRHQLRKVLTELKAAEGDFVLRVYSDRGEVFEKETSLDEGWQEVISSVPTDSVGSNFSIEIEANNQEVVAIKGLLFESLHRRKI